MVTPSIAHQSPVEQQLIYLVFFNVGVTTVTYSYVIPVANLRLLKGETNI